MARITICLGHYKRTGKDSFANYIIELVRKYDPSIKIGKRSIAYKLKLIAHELYGWAGLQSPNYYETTAGEQMREVVLPKLGKSPRQIWIDLGTKAVRDQVYKNTWLDWFTNNPSDNDIDIITDLRFPNEGIAFADLPGIHFIKVVRPGYGPTNDPDRELVGWGGWDNIIGASGSLRELEHFAAKYAHAIVQGLTFDHILISDAEMEIAKSVEVIDA